MYNNIGRYCYTNLSYSNAQSHLLSVRNIASVENETIITESGMSDTDLIADKEIIMR
jgi:hypothetical protein